MIVYINKQRVREVYSCITTTIIITIITSAYDNLTICIFVYKQTYVVSIHTYINSYSCI